MAFVDLPQRAVLPIINSVKCRFGISTHRSMDSPEPDIFIDPKDHLTVDGMYMV